ncbi:hypothetical protein HYDPIDRAFT_30829 [Hydnomerulius pinastri MD-312]|uniref:F-box domain-containing protein n=1 Tax=Hydnomerulius pinastri MD-312 TaxID=994086 RepID=A0A0C9V8I5_9AGAM|nr:hypothetical protein HYDPIDRAFT_30829 [Hydnomerulius pinastri MD-312]
MFVGANEVVALTRGGVRKCGMYSLASLDTSRRATMQCDWTPTIEITSKSRQYSKELTMHRIWTTPDLIWMIFTFLEGPLCHDSPEHRLVSSKGTFLNLAKTCRSFQEPALDIIWAHLDSSKPLLDLVPDSESVGDHWKGFKHRKQWESTEKYTARVQSLNFCRADPLYDILIHWNHQETTRSPLLPKLRRLQYQHLAACEFPPIHVLAGQSLRALHLRFHPHKLPDLRPLPELVSSWSDLEVFKIAGYGTRQENISIVSNLLYTASHLKEIRCEGITGEATLAIAQLTSLKIVDIQPPLSEDNSLYACGTSSGLSPLFRNVRSARLTPSSVTHPFDGLRQVSKFIHATRMMPTDLRIDLFGRPPRDVLADFFSILSSNLALEVLRVSPRDTLTWDVTRPPACAVLNMDVLGPLLRLCNLRELHLEVWYVYEFTDDSLQNFQAKWPRLEKLKLIAEACWCDRHHPPLSRDLFAWRERFQGCESFLFL